MELYPAKSRPHTATRLEFHGSDMDSAVQRLMDDACALPEKTPDGKGFMAVAAAQVTEKGGASTDAP